MSAPDYMDIEDLRLGAAIQANVLAENKDLKLSIFDEEISEKTPETMLQTYLGMIITAVPAPTNKPTEPEAAAGPSSKAVSFSPNNPVIQVIPQDELHNNRATKDTHLPRRRSRRHASMPPDIDLEEHILVHPPLSLTILWPADRAFPLAWYGAIHSLAHGLITILSQVLPDLHSTSLSTRDTLVASQAVCIGYRLHLLVQEATALRTNLSDLVHTATTTLPQRCNEVLAALLIADHPPADLDPTLDVLEQADDCLSTLADLNRSIEENLHACRDQVEYLTALVALLEANLSNLTTSPDSSHPIQPDLVTVIQSVVAEEAAAGLAELEETLAELDDFFCGATPAFEFDGDDKEVDVNSKDGRDKVGRLVQMRLKDAEARVKNTLGEWLKVTRKLHTAHRLVVLEEKRGEKN